MTATGNTANATGVRLNTEVFDVACARHGATTDTARGELLDTDRTTVWRWRNGHQQPSLDAITRIADRLAVTVDSLIDRAA